MPKTKKKFIDRKSAVTFHLVHRSQQDPLAADDTAPQHVLLAAPEKRSKDDKVRKEEQKKFGVFYEDDYNYLQHLKDANAPTVEWEKVERIPKAQLLPNKLPESGMRLNLPSSVFASEVEEEVGLLNKAAPQSGLRLDLDPDVVAAMDEDFDFSDPENELEDNFIELANADCDDNDENYEDCASDEGLDGSDVSSGGSDNEGANSLDGPQMTFADEETKTRFTNYSMSSSIMRRTEHLSILDSRFEHMYISYDDAEIGALDCDEIEGHVAPDDEMVLECAAQFKRERATQRHETDRSMLARYLDTLPESGEEDGEDLEDLAVPDQREKWDCESILSTYSNIYNRPKLIVEPKGPGRIRVSGRTGIPLDVLGGRDGKLTARALAKLDAATNAKTNGDNEMVEGDGAETVMSTLSTLSIRPKGETPAERAERKSALKEYRKERRAERKANSLAFKEEKKRQEKVLLNNNKNKQGIHIL